MPISTGISVKSWLDDKPVSLKSKDVEKAIQALQKAEKDFNGNPGPRSGASLKFSLLDAIKTLRDAKREVDRKDKDGQGVLSGIENALKGVLDSVEARLAEGEQGGGTEDEEDVSDHKLVDPDLVKKLIKKVAKGPMNFAFGYDDAGDPVMILGSPNKKAGKALAALLKDKADVTKPTFGVASEKGDALQFDVQGNKVAGMGKGVKEYLKENKITTYTKIIVNGGEEEAPEGQGEEGPTGTPGPAAMGGQDSEGTAISPGELKTILKDVLKELPKVDLAELTPGILSGLLKEVQQDAPANAGADDMKDLLRELLGKYKGGGKGKFEEKNDDIPPFKPGVQDNGDEVPPFKPGVQDEEPKQDATRPFEIGASVGAKGKNKPEDVQMVQAQLNKVAKSGLEVDGKCGQKTIAAIFKYQKGCGIPADGRIDPGGMTERMLKGKSGGVVGPDDPGNDPSGKRLMPKIPVPNIPGPANNKPLPNTNGPTDPNVPPVAPPPAKGPQKPAPELPPVNGPLALKKPVGKGGTNQKDDVVAAQSALNRNGASLKIDGYCGPKTIAAITAYQKEIGFKRPDGLIEPGKYTENWLNGNQVPLPLDKPQGGGGGVPKAPPAPSQGNGENPNPDQPAPDPDAWLQDETMRTQYANGVVGVTETRLNEAAPLPKRLKDARLAHPISYLKNKGAVDRLIQDAEDRLEQARRSHVEMRAAGAKFMKIGDNDLLKKLQEEERAIYELTQRCTDSANHGLSLLES